MAGCDPAVERSIPEKPISRSKYKLPEAVSHSIRGTQYEDNHCLQRRAKNKRLKVARLQPLAAGIMRSMGLLRSGISELTCSLILLIANTGWQMLSRGSRFGSAWEKRSLIVLCNTDQARPSHAYSLTCAYIWSDVVLESFYLRRFACVTRKL
jgi:hypothetical protein